MNGKQLALVPLTRQTARRMPTTDRILIESLGHEHVDGMVAAPSNEMAEDHWWNWAVSRRADGLILGYVQATGYAGWAEVAYVFGPTTEGHGYATEAVRWLVAHLFEGGRSELWAAIHHDNAASIRLITRVGFTQVATTNRSLASFDEGDLVFVAR